VEKKLDLGNGVQMELVLIPAGRFVMGTAEPVEPDWKKLKWTIQKGQGILALGVLIVLILLFPALWRSIRKRVWPQVTLGRFMLLFLSLSVAIMGGTGWWEGDRALTMAQGAFEAAKARYAEAWDGEKPAHPVVISKPFYMGKYEVTQEEWRQVMNNNPSFFKGSRLPVDQVSWENTQVFFEKVKVLTGQEVRLPSEAEWEHACRAGTVSRFHSGEGDKDLGQVGWYDGNSGKKTHVVGEKSPNGFGLYDMSGNVVEWCQGWFGGFSAEGQVDPVGQPTGSARVFRGGGWNFSARFCRSACRRWGRPGGHWDSRGFRLLAVQPNGVSQAGKGR
jgi:formylglycine-generating enzyme required for sulfatase activity